MVCTSAYLRRFQGLRTQKCKLAQLCGRKGRGDWLVVMHACTHTRTHTPHTCTHVCTHACTHTHRHAHTRTRTCTHTETHRHTSSMHNIAQGQTHHFIHQPYVYLSAVLCCAPDRIHSKLDKIKRDLRETEQLLVFSKQL